MFQENYQKEKINWYYAGAIFIALLILFFLAWVTHSYADVVQSDATGGNYSNSENVVQSLGHLSGTLTGYSINSGNPAALIFSECTIDWGGNTNFNPHNWGASCTDKNFSENVTSVTGLSISLDPAKWYFIMVSQTNSTKRSADDSAYPDGTSWYISGSVQSRDLTFMLTGANPPVFDSISFVHPTATTTQDFSQWIVDYNIVSDFDPQYLKFKFYIGTSTLETVNVWYDGVPIQETVPIFKSTLLPTGTSTVSVEIWNSTDSDLIAESDPVSFYISILEVEQSWESYVSTNFPSTSTPTSTLTIEQTCNQDDPWYQYGICRVLSFLFIPYNFQSEMTQIGNEIQQKVPVAYYVLAKQKFDELTTITATGTKPQIVFADISFDGTSSSSLSFFDPAESVSLAGSSNWNFIKTIVLSGLWISFLIYLLVRGLTFFQGHRKHL